MEVRRHPCDNLSWWKQNKRGCELNLNKHKKSNDYLSKRGDIRRFVNRERQRLLSIFKDRKLELKHTAFLSLHSQSLEESDAFRRSHSMGPSKVSQRVDKSTFYPPPPSKKQKGEKEVKEDAEEEKKYLRDAKLSCEFPFAFSALSFSIPIALPFRRRSAKIALSLETFTWTRFFSFLNSVVGVRRVGEVEEMRCTFDIRLTI